jgi:hypothetical protein
MQSTLRGGRKKKSGVDRRCQNTAIGYQFRLDGGSEPTQLAAAASESERERKDERREAERKAGPVR